SEICSGSSVVVLQPTEDFRSALKADIAFTNTRPDRRRMPSRVASNAKGARRGRSSGGKDRPRGATAKGQDAGAKHLVMPEATDRPIGMRQGGSARVKQSKFQQIVANGGRGADRYLPFGAAGCENLRLRIFLSVCLPVVTALLSLPMVLALLDLA